MLFQKLLQFSIPALALGLLPKAYISDSHANPRTKKITKFRCKPLACALDFDGPRDDPTGSLPPIFDASPLLLGGMKEKFIEATDSYG
jgi:hypothetical protein